MLWIYLYISKIQPVSDQFGDKALDELFILAVYEQNNRCPREVGKMEGVLDLEVHDRF